MTTPGTDPRTDRNDDVDGTCNEVLHQLRKAIVSALCGTAHHDDVPTLFESAFAQATGKRVGVAIVCHLGGRDIGVDERDPRERSRIDVTSHDQETGGGSAE